MGIIKIFILFILIIIFLQLYTKYIESKSIFFPLKNIEVYPSEIGLTFEDIYLSPFNNLKLNGWFIPAKDATYTILFLHGNGGNISHRLEKVKILLECKVNIFLVDYRGYGKSTLKPSEKGIYDDAKIFYDYLIKEKKIIPNNIIVYGESLGTAVAIDLASKENIRALILEGAFDSARSMAKKLYPFIPSFLFSDIFNSFKKIEKIKIDKLFIHSKNDEIIPIEMSRRLYNHAPKPKMFIEVTGGHNTAFIDAYNTYVFSIRSFIENL